MFKDLYNAILEDSAFRRRPPVRRHTLGQSTDVSVNSFRTEPVGRAGKPVQVGVTQMYAHSGFGHLNQDIETVEKKQNNEESMMKIEDLLSGDFLRKYKFYGDSRAKLQKQKSQIAQYQPVDPVEQSQNNSFFESRNRFNFSGNMDLSEPFNRHFTHKESTSSVKPKASPKIFSQSKSFLPKSKYRPQ